MTTVPDLLRVLDLETTGLEDTDKVVEIAAVDVRSGAQDPIRVFGESEEEAA